MSKPKLTDVLPKKKAAAKKRRRKAAKAPANSRIPDAELRKDLIAAWLPHFVAHKFNRTTSIRAAFPNKEWTDNSAKTFARDLMADDNYQSMMDSHLESLGAELSITESFVLAGLYRQALANPMDYFKTDADGNFSLRDISELPVDLQRNIRKIKVTNTVTTKNRERIERQYVELQVVDQQRAYALLGSALAMFVHRHEVDVSDDLATLLERALDRVQRGKAPAALPAPEKRLTH